LDDSIFHLLIDQSRYETNFKRPSLSSFCKSSFSGIDFNFNQKFSFEITNFNSSSVTFSQLGH
jgi:hypothetical protein